jgi:hypothetical protein
LIELVLEIRGIRISIAKWSNSYERKKEGRKEREKQERNNY